MIRKLRDTGDASGYTATALLLVDWDTTTDAPPVVRARPDLVPDDVAPPQFFTRMIDRLLAATPITYHVAVRERREHRIIPSPRPTTQPEAIRTDLRLASRFAVQRGMLAVRRRGLSSCTVLGEPGDEERVWHSA